MAVVKESGFPVPLVFRFRAMLAGRRTILRVGAIAMLGLPLRRWFEEWRALGMEPEAKDMTPFITANKDFYLVAVDPAFRPSFDPASVQSEWALELVGLNGQSRFYAYDELLARASRKVNYTFECIGNSVGGQLIGNASWNVIPLKQLLAEAPRGINRAGSVMFTGLDDFYSSVSIHRAQDDYAFLALKMNDAPLPGAHGFPARVILPNLYGMKQPRWLRRITVQSTATTTSYWEERGWAGEVPVKTMSRLDPRERLLHAQVVPLTGIAFAGQRGISKVEISMDGGSTWSRCRLLTPTAPGVWSLWGYRWRVDNKGSQEIQVRATDGDGSLQIQRRHRSYPDGAAGYDRETVRLAALETR